MGYFDDEKNVEEYIKMSEGINGRIFVDNLRKYLENGSTILELGMGEGKDFDMLSKFFQVTGSDISTVFLERNRKANTGADLVLLDATKMDIDRKFDCIYSNKVLQHLTKEELKESLRQQLHVLNDNGILFHTFWYGDKEEKHSGLLFVYYTEKSFSKIIDEDWEIVESERYAEMEKNDSIYVVMKKKYLKN